MRNGWYSGLAVATLVAGLAAMPGSSGERQSSAEKASQAPALCPFGARETEAMVTQGLASARQELECVKQEMDAEAARATEDVEAELGSLRAELEGSKAELEARAKEVAAQAGALAGQEPGPPDVVGESGWLGVEISEVSPEKAKEMKRPSEGGVLVVEAEKGSPAAKAGLKAGDIVTDYNKEHVQGVFQFRRLVRETLPGRSAELQIWRDGRSEKLTVILAGRREVLENGIPVFGPHDFDFHVGFPGMHHWAGPVLGAQTQDIRGQLAAYFGVPGSEGILIEEVLLGSAAEKAGLKAGDVIIKVDGEPVKTTMELREGLRRKRDEKSATLGVVRKGAEISLPVEIQWPKPPAPPHIARRMPA